MSVTTLRPKIPVDAAHSFFRSPLPVGSEVAEHWLAWFRIKGTQIEVVIDPFFNLMQIYKHHTIVLKTCDHPTVLCCQRGGVK
jgi:hypothetical protein